MKPQSVLVTGSAGRVGSAACQALLERGHRVRGFDVVPSLHLQDAVVGDIADFKTVLRAMQGIDTVIHCAATPVDDDFRGKLLPNNIVGVYNMLEGARQAKVRRAVLASTGQVVMGHTGPWPITPTMPATPRNWYAAAKVMAEAAGQVYAHVHGMNVVAVRLGWCPRDKAHADELAGDKFGQDVYLSAPDAGRFFCRAVEANLTQPYCLVFATSRPARQTRYEIESTKELLGYEPLDRWPEGTEKFGEYHLSSGD